MRLQVSKSLALTSGQLLVNLFLASWLVSEYLHNPFMQQYLSKLWTTNSTLISIGIGLIVTVILGSYLTFFSKMTTLGTTRNDPLSPTASSTSLKPLDVCPVCSGALRELSSTRFQCRSCRRYFKK